MVEKLTEEISRTCFLPNCQQASRPSRDMGPFRIELKEGTQPFGRYGPRMTEEDTQEAGKMIEELLAKGFIRPLAPRGARPCSWWRSRMAASAW